MFSLYTLALLALLDPSAGTTARAASVNSPSQFTEYAPAYREAQRSKKPLLVILNPGEKSSVKLVSLSDVSKTDRRRELLERYVVVVIDTSTEEGTVAHRLFDQKPLPHVSVIDRDQKVQTFRTSRALQGEDWNKILETFQTGDGKAKLNLEKPFCPSCQLYSQMQTQP